MYIYKVTAAVIVMKRQKKNLHAVKNSLQLKKKSDVADFLKNIT